MNEPASWVQRVGAYAVCVSAADQLLLARFPAPDLRWSLPGGGVENGEHPGHAVVREVHEETGMHVEVTRLLGVESETWPSGRAPGTEVHSINVLYEVAVTGGELRDEVGGSTDRAGWFPLSEVPTLHRGTIIDLALARLAQSVPR